MSEPTKQPETVEQVCDKIASRISWSIEGSVEDIAQRYLESYKSELIAAIGREARVDPDNATETARTLRMLVSNQRLSESVREALDAVLRALEGEPIDLTLLASRIARLAA